MSSHWPRFKASLSSYTTLQNPSCFRQMVHVFQTFLLFIVNINMDMLALKNLWWAIYNKHLAEIRDFYFTVQLSYYFAGRVLGNATTTWKSNMWDRSQSAAQIIDRSIGSFETGVCRGNIWTSARPASLPVTHSLRGGACGIMVSLKLCCNVFRNVTLIPIKASRSRCSQVVVGKSRTTGSDYLTSVSSTIAKYHRRTFGSVLELQSTMNIQKGFQTNDNVTWIQTGSHKSQIFRSAMLL